ncbi:hypothetical protein ES332_A09G178100v1 [Gossypium tomentosum]|uniref:Uncharacterized protein n=1 Tax=Gossypium tomentosum TaxID=34277 RepID=A0A5D2P8E3_GOSTO|nr:hypothetical protein ES332_A09G178100v1 [Gossypium tomentosum]
MSAVIPGEHICTHFGLFMSAVIHGEQVNGLELPICRTLRPCSIRIHFDIRIFPLQEMEIGLKMILGGG